MVNTSAYRPNLDLRVLPVEKEADKRPATATEVQAALGAIAAVELATAFARAHHQLYLVGGSVRDARLGRRHEDLDLSTDATPDQTLALVQPVATAV